MVNERDLGLSDGRRLHIYDTRADAVDERLAIFWHHGTPNLGQPPEPLLPAAAQRGIRWVSYDRPGYGGSTANPGRDVASAAADASAIADALGIGRFAVLGHSGGGTHALASGALLSERVIGVVSVSGLAPYAAEGLDWFAGMAAAGAADARRRRRTRGAHRVSEIQRVRSGTLHRGGSCRAEGCLALAGRHFRARTGGRPGRHGRRRPRLRRPVGL